MSDAGWMSKCPDCGAPAAFEGWRHTPTCPHSQKHSPASPPPAATASAPVRIYPKSCDLHPRGYHEACAAVDSEIAALRAERDEALRLLTRRVEATRLDEANAEVARLTSALEGVVGYLDALGHTPEVCTLITKPCPLCAARRALASSERGAP